MALQIDSVINRLVEVGDIHELRSTPNSFINFGPTLPITKQARDPNQWSSYLHDETLLPDNSSLDSFRGTYRLAHLADACVTPRSAIEHQGLLIAEAFGPSYSVSAISKADQYYKLASLDFELSRQDIDYISDEHYFLSNEINDRNPFHFLHIALPRIAPYLNLSLYDIPLYSGHTLTSFQVDLLSKLPGLDRISFGSSSKCYRFKSLFLPIIGQPYLLHAPNYSAHQKIREVVLNARPREAGVRRLYISRSDASSRRILNEDRLIPLLETYGFETVEMSKISPEEQIVHYIQSEVTLFPFGAGAAFLGFQKPGSIAIEISPERAFGPHFKLISLRHGLQYLKFSDEVSIMSGNFKIKIDKLSEFLRRVFC